MIITLAGRVESGVGKDVSGMWENDESSKLFLSPYPYPSSLPLLMSWLIAGADFAIVGVSIKCT